MKRNSGKSSSIAFKLVEMKGLYVVLINWSSMTFEIVFNDIYNANAQG
jgi:hypothetical protein